MASDKDLYAALGVSKSASDDALRKAYRQLARQNHPDVNPGDKAAEERFKEASAAYEVLGDPAKRKLYDEFGSVGLREGFDANKARAYQRYAGGSAGAAGGWAGGGPGPGMGGQEFDLSDIFGDWFGGAGKRNPRSRFGRGRDLSALVDIDLTQALAGCEIGLSMPAQAACASCGGSASVAGKACPACRGSGRVAQGEVLTVRIPKGADHGSKLRVAGRGEPGSGGAAAGDLLIETRIRPHPYFRREGLNLILHLPVRLDEAYNGASIAVPTPSGMVSLRVPPRTQQGTRLRLRGKGVERGKQAGDLFVDIDVRLPDRDDKKLASALTQAAAAYAQPVRGELRL